jgi:hypothetical protein
MTKESEIFALDFKRSFKCSKLETFSAKFSIPPYIATANTDGEIITNNNCSN